MNRSEIKTKLQDLAKKHSEIDEDWEAEDLESHAEDLIISYCKEQGYEVNGFPFKHSDEDWEDDEFEAYERYKLYLDTLMQSHDDVLDLMWTFTSSFWPTEFLNKEAYKKRTQEDLDSGVLYDVEL